MTNSSSFRVPRSEFRGAVPSSERQAHAEPGTSNPELRAPRTPFHNPQSAISNRREPVATTEPTIAPEALNPSVAYYGRGPLGARCGSCINLAAVRIPTKSAIRNPQSAIPEQTIYYCCLDQGPKHVTWPACSRFREAPLPRSSLKSQVPGPKSAMPESNLGLET